MYSHQCHPVSIVSWEAQSVTLMARNEATFEQGYRSCQNLICSSKGNPYVCKCSGASKLQSFALVGLLKNPFVISLAHGSCLSATSVSSCRLLGVVLAINLSLGLYPNLFVEVSAGKYRKHIVFRRPAFVRAAAPLQMRQTTS
eukprot:SAG31_NODE_8001_length_1544_cov_1.057439_2_plen_143_part_00